MAAILGPSIREKKFGVKKAILKINSFQMLETIEPYIIRNEGTVCIRFTL